MKKDKIIRTAIKIGLAIMLIAMVVNMVIIGTKIANYMSRGFAFNDAYRWAIEDYYNEVVPDQWKGETYDDDSVIVYPMVYQNISIVACTALK